MSNIDIYGSNNTEYSVLVIGSHPVGKKTVIAQLANKKLSANIHIPVVTDRILFLTNKGKYILNIREFPYASEEEFVEITKTMKNIIFDACIITCDITNIIALDDHRLTWYNLINSIYSNIIIKFVGLRFDNTFQVTKENLIYDKQLEISCSEGNSLIKTVRDLLRELTKQDDLIIFD